MAIFQLRCYSYQRHYTRDKSVNRSFLLDFLRVFAIGLVLVAHLGQLLDSQVGDFFGVKNFYFVSLGGIGVSIFLILSGILAGLSRDNGSFGYLPYLFKKILRIYPLYWISVSLSMIAYVIGSLMMEGRFPKLFPNGLMLDAFGSLTGFYAWLGLWGGPYNSPSWFISLIMTMYVLFPPLYFLMKRAPHLVLVIVLIITVSARIYVGQEGIPFANSNLFEAIQGWVYRQYGFMPGRPGDWFPPCRIFEFGLGVYLAIVLPKSTWFKVNLPVVRPIRVLSDLAFPIFLVHYPLMFLIPVLIENGMAVGLSIGLFLVIVIFISYWIDQLDQRVPRKRLQSLFTKKHCW